MIKHYTLITMTIQINFHLSEVNMKNALDILMFNCAHFVLDWLLENLSFPFYPT